MERKRIIENRKISTIFVSFLLISFGNILFLQNYIIPIAASNGSISESWYNTSSLKVSVIIPKPEIVWYDFQYYNGTKWISRLNQQIDVNNSAKYRFIVKILSYQGWDDINFINITSWFDQGDENSYYNQTLGGNINLYMTYENKTGNAYSRMMWPDDEVRFIGYNEEIVKSSFTNWHEAETRNISFEFIPGYQFRYASGPDRLWDSSSRGWICSNQSHLKNKHSWNFNVTVTDGGEDNSGIPLTTWVSDEFGVHSYSEVYSTGNPAIYGRPGFNYSVNDNGGSGNISIVTRSNGNYSLSATISDLTNDTIKSCVISKENVWIRGGDRLSFDNFSKKTVNNSIYLYGGDFNDITNYHIAEDDGTNKTTNNIEYKCYIDLGIQPGIYTTMVYYYLKTELL